MSSFIIKGDCDDVLAKLKTTLKAQDAKFDANLQSQFKAPATPPRQFKPAPAPLPPRQFKPAPLPPRQPGAAVAAPAGKPASSTGSATGSLLSSSRNADDSVRGRLHTSQRSTQPR